jgi:hypothetical protein
LLDRLPRRLNDAGERGKRLRTSLVLGTMRDFPGNDRRSEYAFGTVVGGLDSLDIEKREQAATILLKANPIQ